MRGPAQNTTGRIERRWLNCLGAATWPEVVRRYCLFHASRFQDPDVTPTAGARRCQGPRTLHTQDSTGFPAACQRCKGSLSSKVQSEQAEVVDPHRKVQVLLKGVTSSAGAIPVCQLALQWFIIVACLGILPLQCLCTG